MNTTQPALIGRATPVAYCIGQQRLFPLPTATGGPTPIRATSINRAFADALNTITTRPVFARLLAAVPDFPKHAGISRTVTARALLAAHIALTASNHRATNQRLRQLLSTDTALPELNEHNRRQAAVADDIAVTAWNVRHTTDQLSAAADLLRPGTTLADLIELATGQVA